MNPWLALMAGCRCSSVLYSTCYSNYSSFFDFLHDLRLDLGNIESLRDFLRCSDGRRYLPSNDLVNDSDEMRVRMIDENG